MRHVLHSVGIGQHSVFSSKAVPGRVPTMVYQDIARNILSSPKQLEFILLQRLSTTVIPSCFEFFDVPHQQVRNSTTTHLSDPVISSASYVSTDKPDVMGVLSRT